MDNNQINQCLIEGLIDQVGVLPHLDTLKEVSFVFEQNFGLPKLPTEGGIILIRGPRQYGKSTWLEQQIYSTLQEFGKGSALYLNGDEIKDSNELLEKIRIVIQLFSPRAPVKRLFIDEITAIANWAGAIKRLSDAGELLNILLISTGSKATDLRRATERLPGRKGKLSRTDFLFTPISYAEFKRKCSGAFQSDLLYAYILSGGSPISANALAATGRIPDYVVSIITDWIYGEFAASGRSRSHLLAVFQSLYKMAGTPIGQAKLARESGLSNNTTAQSYIELLMDLMTVLPSYPFDTDKQISIFRKPCKYHFINLMAALSWHPKKPRTIAELKSLDPKELAPIFEWVISQEITRRQCILNTDGMPEYLNFWQSKEHEIDFVLPKQNLFLEVKSGESNPIHFTWFLKNFKKGSLLIVGKNTFETERMKGITLEEFLLEED